MNQNGTKAREAVHALFLNPTTLQLKATDRHVDQVAKLVECISDQIHQKEKICLLDQVKLAKRLSRERNLLNHGDFGSPIWSDENGWKTSNHVFMTSDNPIFKGRYLNLPSANNPQFSDKVFPTYAYQKIEESKLKPYTRYMVRGFVGSSKDLEVLVARYDKEVYKRMNVPDDIIPTNPSTGEPFLTPTPYPVTTYNTIPQAISCSPCGNRYETTAGMIGQQTNVICQDSHEFTFHIDTGELDMERNLGIWLGFKIGTTDGRAKLGNVEVVEMGPLTGDVLTRMQKREQKWKKKWAEKRLKIKRAVQVARDTIQTLFTDPNQNRLQSAITLKNILDAEKWVQKIPYVYNQFLQGVLPAVPGETYDIFLQLSDVITKARALYDQRNVLNNGNFTAGLSNWHVTEGTDVQQIGNAFMLVISDWSATLSQHVCVEPEHSYLLRVTAKKEGSGEGYITISDGTEENTETLTFLSDDEMSTKSLRDTSIETTSMGEAPYVGGSNTMNVPSNRYTGNSYPGGNNMNHPYMECSYPSHTNTNYQSESFGFTSYGDQNQMMNTPSNNDEMNAYPSENNLNYYSAETYGTESYPSSSPITAQNGFSLSGYVTKTVEIFPETNRVRIEIGETAGTFMVEIIELIRIGC